MSRDELVAKARSLGVERPELMTRVELGDEIVRRTQSDPVAQQRARGWLGVARDLVASVVSTGLSMPDAAALIRGDRSALEFKGPSPVATVTLAEIYATQGHIDRALNMLDEVLAREPEHAAAHALRERLRTDPRARRAEGSGARSPESDREPLVAEAPASADADIEAAPDTSPTPPAVDPVIAAATDVAEAQAVADAVAQVVERADEHLVAADAGANQETAEHVSDFEPVSLAPPLSAEQFREPAPEPSVEPPPLLEPEPVESEPPPEPLGEPEPPFEPEPPPLVESGRFEPEPPLLEAELEPEAAHVFDASVVEPTQSLLPPAGLPSDVAPTLAPPRERQGESEPLLIVVHRSDAEPIVCWELADLDVASELLELECHGFSASARGAERRTITLPVAAHRGSAKLPGFTNATLVRAALGVHREGTFVPLVIASELSEHAGALDVRFRPPLSAASTPTPSEQSLVAHFTG
jgi:hypothetical protein